MLQNKCLRELNEHLKAGNANQLPNYTMKRQGRPLLFQQESDRAVKELINLIRSIRSAVNAWVVMKPLYVSRILGIWDIWNLGHLTYVRT